MNDTLITLQGNLGGDVVVRDAGDSRVATFRVASTPRRFVRPTGTWEDGTTQWYSVSAWRALADHCADSLRRGDPVFVQGRLRASTWVSNAGVEVTTYEVDAIVVGHDLSRGTSTFVRSGRLAQPGPEAQASGAEPAPGSAVEAVPAA